MAGPLDTWRKFDSVVFSWYFLSTFRLRPYSFRLFLPANGDPLWSGTDGMLAKGRLTKILNSITISSILNWIQNEEFRGIRNESPVKLVVLDLFTEFSKIIVILNTNDINYAICGGLAASFLTEPRFTQDIDILIDENHCDRVKDLLQTLGYKFYSSPMQLASKSIEIHKLTKIESGETDYLFADLIVPLSEELQKVLQNRIQVDWQNKKVWIVSSEGLIRLKEASKRSKDLMDIEKLRKKNS